MADSRNLITAEIAERNRQIGGYTFNAFPPDEYVGLVMVFAVVRLGDHAHVEILSGRWNESGPSSTGSPHVGLAGRIVLRWHEWVAWRDLMDATTPYRIAEVEQPTLGQLDRYVSHAPRDVGEQIFH